MAIIIGLEEKERVLKMIENKIKEVEDINVFLMGLEQEQSRVILNCIEPDKRKHKIELYGSHLVVAEFIKEQRDGLAAEIKALCEANHIALNEEEKRILGISEHTESLADFYEETQTDSQTGFYDKPDYYVSGEEYSEA